MLIFFFLCYLFVFALVLLLGFSPVSPVTTPLSLRVVTE